MKDNNKNNIYIAIFVICFSTMISSVLLFRNLLDIGGISSQIKLKEGLIANEYYSSKLFDEYINTSISKSLEIVVSSESTYKDIERARLDSISNMKFFAINKYTEEVYTNTSYETEREFTNYMKDYCNIQITNGGKGYIKSIGNNKMINYNSNNTEIDTKLKNIHLYLSFPNIITEGDEVYESYYYYQNYKSMAQITLLLIIASTLLSVLMSVVLAKNSLIPYRSKGNIPIELEVIILIISALFLMDSLRFMSFYKLVIVSISIFAGSIAILGIIKKCNYYNGIYNVLKMSSISQITSKNIQKFSKLIKDILLTKKILAVGIIALTLNITGYSFDIFFNKRFFSFIFSTFSIILITTYLIIKLSYLNHIMNSANKIREGNYTYKAKIKGNDNFTQLAENINNIGQMQEEAVENKLLNEKVKLKLIYNTGLSIKNNIENLNIDSDILDSDIGELLELSNSTDDEMKSNNSDLIRIIDKSINEKSNENIDSNLEIIFNRPSEKVYLSYNEITLNKILNKILDNIYKYSLQNTRVYIDLEKESERVKLVIKNISSSKIEFDNSNLQTDDKSTIQIIDFNSITLIDLSYLIKNKGGNMKIDTDGDLFKITIVF